MPFIDLFSFVLGGLCVAGVMLLWLINELLFGGTEND